MTRWKTEEDEVESGKEDKGEAVGWRERERERGICERVPAVPAVISIRHLLILLATISCLSHSPHYLHPDLLRILGIAHPLLNCMGS